MTTVSLTLFHTTIRFTVDSVDPAELERRLDRLTEVLTPLTTDLSVAATLASGDVEIEFDVRAISSFYARTQSRRVFEAAAEQADVRDFGSEVREFITAG